MEQYLLIGLCAIRGTKKLNYRYQDAIYYK